MQKLTSCAVRTIHILVIMALVAGLMPPASPASASQIQESESQAKSGSSSRVGALADSDAFVPEDATTIPLARRISTAAAPEAMGEGDKAAAQSLALSIDAVEPELGEQEGFNSGGISKGADVSYVQTGSDAYVVCRTSDVPPYNVLVIGDSHDFETTSPDNGFFVAWSYHRGFNYTPHHGYYTVTLTFEMNAGAPTDWVVGGVDFKNGCGYHKTLFGTAGAWQWITWTQACPNNGFQERVEFSPGGGNEYWIRRVKVTVDTRQNPDPIPPDRTYAPEDACLANNPQARAADPVNTYTGNFSHQVVDVAIPTRGLPLTFERSYNSLDTYSGPLGQGWTHNYNMHLTVEGDTVTLMAPRGSRLRFTGQGGGAFAAGPGVRATLVRHGDGTYTLTRGDQLVYTFDATGRLTALADTQANTTTLTYSGDNLTAVTAPDGRALTLSYDGQGRITQLTDPLGRTVSYTYDANGHLSTVTDRRGGVTHYTYDAAGRLSSFTDPNGHTVANAYDAQGRVITQTDALGQAMTFAYGDGQTAVTDPNSHATTHTYDPVGLLVSVTDALGNTTAYTYDQNFNRTAVTDPLGRTTHFTWDGCGCGVTSITDPLGQTTTFAYDERHNLIGYTDPLSRTTAFAYDAQDNLTVITNALGYTTTFTYDAYGQMLSSTDANGHTTRYAYDAYGNLTTITNSLGYVTRLSYDLAGRLVQITNPKSQITNYQYDPGDNLVKVTDALNGETTYGYDAVSNLVAITDANGHTTTFAYDAADRLITTTNALGARTVYGYDPAGNLTQITDPQSQITNLQYDAADRLIAVTDPLGYVTRYGYDAIGNLTAITDANGIATHYGYDALNRLVRVTDALGGVTSYAYDAVGNRTVITDANGHVSHFTYDGLNRLASRADPLNHTWVYGYDPVGNLTQITNPQSSITHYQYDVLNRLTTIDYPTPQGDVSFTYDAVGNRLTMADPTGTTTYAYDALNRLISVAQPGGGTVSYGYDAVGNLIQLTNPQYQITHYQYDAANRLETVTDWSSGRYTYTYDAAGRLTGLSAPNGVRSSYHYDKAGRLTCLDHATADETLASYRYTLDAVGNRTRAVESQTPCLTDIYLPIIMKNAPGGGPMAVRGGEEDETLPVLPGLFDSPISPPTLTPPATIEGLIAALDAAYQQGQIDNQGIYHSLRAKLSKAQDDLNQSQTDKAVHELEAFVHEVEAQRGKHITAEAADQLIALAQQLITQLSNTQYPTSNPKSLISNLQSPTVVTYTYDALYRLTAAAYSTGESFAYTYDAVGNRLSLVTNSGSTSYGYDAADRLTSVNGVGYTWDDNGNLLSDGVRAYSYDAADRLVGVSGGGVNAAYTYNGDGLRVGQTINGQGTTFTWDVAAPLPQVLATSNGAAYVYGLGLLAQQQSGTWQYPLPDGLGSVRQWTDASRQVTYAARYAPFGALLWQQGTAPGPWGFAGEFQDPTGLIYLRARWYDPAIGRFLTRDPFPGLAMLPATQHPYVYVGNNPVNLTDPSGEFAFVIPLLLGAAIGGGLAAYNYFQTQPCATFPSALSDPGFLRAVGIGMLTGAVGGLIGFGVGVIGAGAFGGGLAGVIITGAVGGGLAGGAVEALTQLALYGQIRNPQLVGAAMLSGVVSGGVFGAVGYGLRGLRPTVRLDPNAIGRAGEEAAGSTERAFAPGKWLPHFEKHGAEFGYKTPIEYLRGAQRLTAGGEGIQTFVRANGDTLFYNPSTNEFAVLSKENIIRTYFKPVEGLLYWLRQTGGR